MQELRKLLFPAFFLFFAFGALAQQTNYSVHQKGTITAGHGVSWASPNTIQDSGSTSVPPGILPVANGGANYVTAFGAKCDGVTDDSAALQRALNAAGHVLWPPGGVTCLSNSQLVLQSNTWLDLNTGTLVYPATGSFGSGLVNESVNNTQRTVSDGAMTSGSATLTSATANFTSADVNRSVHVVGANFADTSNSVLCATILTVTNSTTVTLSLPAQQTVSGATVTFYNRDANIRISNGTLGSPIATVTNYPVVLRRIDGLTIDHVQGSLVNGNMCMHIGDVTNVITDTTAGGNGCQGIHFVGPSTNISMRNVSGLYNDDVAAFTARDWPGKQDTYGPIAGITVDGVNISGSTGSSNLVKLVGGTPQATLSGVLVKNLYATQATVPGIAVAVGSDTNSGGYTSLSNFVIDTIEGMPSGNVVALNATNGVDATIRNMNLGSNSSGALAGVVVPSGNSWENILIDGASLTNTGTATVSMFQGASGSTVTNLTMNNIRQKTTNNSVGQIALMQGAFTNFRGGSWKMETGGANGASGTMYGICVCGATSGEVQLDGVQVLNSNSTTHINLVGLVGSGSSLTNLLGDNIQFTSSDNSLSHVVDVGSSTTLARYALNNVHTEGGHAVLNVHGTMTNGDLNNVSAHTTADILVANTSSPIDLQLNNLFLDNLSSTALFTNGAALTIRGKGLRCLGSCAASNFIGRNASENITLYNMDAPCDVTKLTRTNGEYCHNTNTAPGSGTLTTDGLVGDQGTASGSWFLLSNPTGQTF